MARAGQQEAFQLLQNCAGIFYALVFLAMFALPLVGRQRAIAKPPLRLQAASISGFVMTAMYLVLSLFPVIDVPHPLLFTAKVRVLSGVPVAYLLSGSNYITIDAGTQFPGATFTNGGRSIRKSMLSRR